MLRLVVGISSFTEDLCDPPQVQRSGFLTQSARIAAVPERSPISAFPSYREILRDSRDWINDGTRKVPFHFPLRAFGEILDPPTAGRNRPQRILRQVSLPDMQAPFLAALSVAWSVLDGQLTRRRELSCVRMGRLPAGCAEVLREARGHDTILAE
jgi:hypothetical protein